MGRLLMMLQSLAMIIARLMWLRLGLGLGMGLGITFSHHWYFHFDNDFHKTPICARVSCMAQGLTSPTSDLPFFRSSAMSTSKEQLLPLCCLGHVCLDSCKDNTLLDLCVCVFDKWWRRRCCPHCPPPALASVSSVFFFVCFCCSHTHCRCWCCCCCRRFASLLILIRIVLARILVLLSPWHPSLPVTPCPGPIPLSSNEPGAWYVLILLIASPEQWLRGWGAEGVT